jgi:hypothetical protein
MQFWFEARELCAAVWLPSSYGLSLLTYAQASWPRSGLPLSQTKQDYSVALIGSLQVIGCLYADVVTVSLQDPIYLFIRLFWSDYIIIRPQVHPYLVMYYADGDFILPPVVYVPPFFIIFILNFV